MNHTSFRRCQEVARATKPGEWEVLSDALIEAGFVNPEGLSRLDLAVVAQRWARENAYRGTGRTTRMLREAVHLAEDGARVLVLAANKNHADPMRDQAYAMTTDGSARGRLHVLAATREETRMYNYDHITEDHYTRECRGASPLPSDTKGGG